MAKPSAPPAAGREIDLSHRHRDPYGTSLSSLRAGARGDNVDQGICIANFITARVQLAVLIGAGIAAAAHGQLPPVPKIAVSTFLIDRATPQADTGAGVVFVVRDVDTPSKSLEQVRLTAGVPGTDVWARPTHKLDTGADGTAHLELRDSLTLEVLVLRVGYRRASFIVPLARRCHQTVEVYISREITWLGAPNPPATPARVMLTTCSPPA